jgi:hypothetical protein
MPEYKEAVYQLGDCMRVVRRTLVVEVVEPGQQIPEPTPVPDGFRRLIYSAIGEKDGRVYVAEEFIEVAPAVQARAELTKEAPKTNPFYRKGHAP